MSVEVDLQDVLKGSSELSSMAMAYSDAIAKFRTVHDDAVNLFETGDLIASWTESSGALWSIFADSQDNLHDCARTLVRYVNATCAQDHQAAEDLKKSVKGANNGQWDLWDRDGDGTIGWKNDEGKRAGYTKDQFNDLDADHDGQLSKHEQRSDVRVNPALDLPDLGNPGSVYKDPDYDRAERPEGGH